MLGEVAPNGPIQREMASKSKVKQTVAVEVLISPSPQVIVNSGSCASPQLSSRRTALTGAFAQPIQLCNPAAEAIPRTFGFCIEAKETRFQANQSAKQRQADPGWRYRELVENHPAPVTAQHETAALVLPLILTATRLLTLLV
jgi:hypothetical protein